MPGGRLTQDDREDIAAGLAERLGYAEIARRLGRPTSTISREVDRNGGPAGYRAAQAHQDTGRRARRVIIHPVVPDSAPPPAEGFADEFVALMVSTGLSRMAARVLACLVTTDSGALTAAELVQLLRVSPASVSKAVGYLVGLDLVRRDHEPRSRRERYVIDDDTWLRTWLTSAQTNARWAEIAERGAKVFGPASPAGARLVYMGQFFGQLSDDMAGGAGAVAFGDALTVLAALVHAGRPLTGGQLAAALGWSRYQVENAVADARRRPDLTDPIVLWHGADGYSVRAAPARLDQTQRDALSAGDRAGGQVRTTQPRGKGVRTANPAGSTARRTR